MTTAKWLRVINAIAKHFSATVNERQIDSSIKELERNRKKYGEPICPKLDVVAVPTDPDFVCPCKAFREEKECKYGLFIPEGLLVCSYIEAPCGYSTGPGNGCIRPGDMKCPEKNRQESAEYLEAHESKRCGLGGICRYSKGRGVGCARPSTDLVCLRCRP